MTKTPIHVSDEELLRFADGEVPSGRATRIREHLAVCRTCSTRLTEIEGTIADVRDVHRGTLDPQVLPATGSRALLRMRMAEAVVASRQRPWFARIPIAFFGQPLAGAGAFLFLILLGLGIIRYLPRYHEAEPPAAQLDAKPTPNSRLTPGAIRSVSLSDICATGHRDMNRDVPSLVRQKVLREYGLVAANPDDYEIDYLITPELGGASDIRNLWPEPYTTTEWNAHVKDALEDRFHRLVCDGKIDLATAQHAIATNWISAYKNYFHTDKPFPSHSYQTGAPANREDEKQSGNST